MVMDRGAKRSDTAVVGNNRIMDCGIAEADETAVIQTNIPVIPRPHPWPHVAGINQVDRHAVGDKGRKSFSNSLVISICSWRVTTSSASILKTQSLRHCASPKRF